MATPFQVLQPQRLESRILKIDANALQIPVDVLRILVTELSPYELVPLAGVSRYVRRLASTEILWAPVIVQMGVRRQELNEGDVEIAVPSLEPKTALDVLQPPSSTVSSYSLFVKISTQLAPLYFSPSRIINDFADLCDRSQIVGQMLRFAPAFAPELYKNSEIETVLRQQFEYLHSSLTEQRETAISSRKLELLPKLCAALCALGDTTTLESLYLEAHPLIQKYYQSRDPERFLMEEARFGRTLDREIFGSFFAEIATDLNYYGKEEIDKLFPPSNHIYLKLYRALVDQVLFELLSNIFAVLKLRSEIEYLKLVPAVFTGLEEFARKLVPCENSGPDVTRLAMEELSAACERHIGAFLQQQRNSFRESLSFKVNKWNRSIAANEFETERLIWSSVPRQVDKKNFLTSFRKALMLKSDTGPASRSAAASSVDQRKVSGKQPPLIAGLISPRRRKSPESIDNDDQAESDDSESEMGFVPLGDDQAGNEFFVFQEQSGSESDSVSNEDDTGISSWAAEAGFNEPESQHKLEPATKNGNNDDGDGDGPPTEQPHASLQAVGSNESALGVEFEGESGSLATPISANFATNSADNSLRPRTELEAQTAILTTKLQGIDRLFSLDLAIDLINDCKREIHQLRVLSHFGSEVKKQARKNAELLFVDLVEILNDKHIHYGFLKALETLRMYDPKKFGRLVATSGEESISVDPLVVFSGLVNVGDLIQQTLHMFFEQELVAHEIVDRNDFVAPSVIAKRKFEKQLDEAVSEGLSLGIDALMDQADFVLITEQLGSDYCPVPGTVVELGPSAAAIKVLALIKAHIDLLSGSLDESMMDVFKQEVGLRLFGSLCKHIKRSVISVDGAIMLISDMNVYYHFVLSLRQRTLYPYFEALKQVAQLYLVSPSDGKQLGLAISDMSRFRGVLPPEELIEFVQRRQDWPLVKSKVEKAIYGFGDCVIC